jgi:hypothetical protein
MTDTYRPLATVTLGSAASSVTFSSIPATYRDLILVATGTSTADADIQITINSDTTSGNYSRVTASGNLNNLAVSSTTSGNQVTFWGFWSSSQVATFTNQFMDYSATDKHKTFLTRANRSGSGADMIASRWANTAAITSISLATVGTTFVTGSTFNLFGVSA